MIHTRRERQKRFVLFHHKFQDTALDHYLLFPFVSYEQHRLFVYKAVSKVMLYKQHYVTRSQNSSGISNGSAFYVEWKVKKTRVCLSHVHNDHMNMKTS